VGKRFGLSTNDQSALVGALRTSGYRNLAVRCERLLEQCDSFAAAGIGGGPSLDDLKQSAVALANELQSQRPAAGRVVRRLRPTAAALLLAVASLAGANVNAAETIAVLTPPQQETILAEATARYDAAQQAALTDSAEAKEAFADAAQKYQLLVDQGIHNANLYFNLGNAYLESGATGRAIANYDRALRLDPTNAAARTNLDFAQARLAANSKDAAPAVERSSLEWATLANGWLNRFVSPQAALSLAVAAWFAFWIALGLRLWEVRFAWKSVAAAALSIAALAATSYALTTRSLTAPAAIVVSPAVELRTGDGDNFPAVAGAKLAEGQSVDFLRQRGDWIQVRTPAGQSGWLASDSAEVL
jgi:tetratricopeptide (TPR) repeat protein